MVNVDEVVTEVRLDDGNFDRGMDKLERRLEKVDREAQRRSKSRGAALVGAASGAVAGFVAAAATQNDAVRALVDLTVNLVAAVLLPVLIAALPLLETLTPALQGVSNAIAPVVGFLSEAVASLLNFITDPNASFYELIGADPQNPGFLANAARVSPFGAGLATGQAVVGNLDDPQSIPGAVLDANAETSRAGLALFAESWDWTKERASSVGGWFS